MTLQFTQMISQTSDFMEKQKILQASNQQIIENIKDLRQSLADESVVWQFNQDNAEWEKAQLLGTDAHVFQEKDYFSTLTINVLTDSTWEAPLKRNALFSSERYQYILDSIAKLRPFVATFNEGTRNFYDLLKESDWVRNQYWISDFQHEQSDGSFNILISRIRPICHRMIKVENLPRLVVTAYFRTPTNILSVSAVHLTSLAKNTKIREQQLQSLTKILKQFNKKVKVQILQGDMNLHSEEQNAALQKLSLSDCWMQKYDIGEFPGFTFDSEVNTLINEVYYGYESRRMRLDRILYLADPNCELEIGSIEVILSDPIFGEKKKVEKIGFLKGSVELITDIFGFNTFRQKEQYLYPSDHFGLLCCLKIKPIHSNL